VLRLGSVDLSIRFVYVVVRAMQVTDPAGWSSYEGFGWEQALLPERRSGPAESGSRRG